jgi:uncharacterized protein involved in outer membrane biogenesis
MKMIKRILLVVVLLIVVGLVVLYFSLNGIVKRTIETQATSSLNVGTTLGAANLNLLGGDVSLKNLEISSPEGFSSPKIFTLGGVDVNTSISELRQTPLRVAEILIDQPKLVIEQKGMKTNVQALLDKMPKGDPAPTDTSGKQSEPLKLIIGTLQLKDTQLVIKSDALDKEYSLNIPTVTVKDIGTAEGNKNGVAVKEVVTLAMQGIMKEAANSDKLPEPVKVILSGNLNDLAARAGDELKKRGEALKTDLTNKATGELNKVLGKNDGKTPTTQDVKDKAAEGLKDLLGGSKKK